ncbi:MAG: 2OG-Fe(II) oxygenase family protein [Lysobacterales bacterium]
MISLNPALDRTAIAQALDQQGYIQIDSFLVPTGADSLAEELNTLTQWDLSITGPDGPLAVSADELKALSAAGRARLSENLRRQSRSGFSFSYLRRDVVPADSPICAPWADWLASPECMPIWRELTGRPSLQRADAHACLYQPGHFLRTHDDTYSGKQRRYAYVMNFTKGWQCDWGGQLNLVSEGEIRAVLAPHFNSLCLFQVPQDHFVSQVASFARSGRYSITGWLFDSD